MDFVFAAAGLALLLAGGEALVRGAGAVAERLGASKLVIGVTIVGFGTSAPELVIGIDAALKGASGIMVGNVVGSNMANMMLILGAAAAVCAMPVSRDALRRDAAMAAAATAVFAMVALGGSAGAVHGALMAGALVTFIAYSLWSDIRAGGGGESEAHAGGNIWRPAAFIVAGIVLLMTGAELLVEGSLALARAAGVSEEVIGLTLVAVGTSLPEFTTSMVAAFRRNPELCIGNVLGSNIFNLLGVTGVAAMVAPITFHDKILTFDLWALIAMTVVLVAMMLSGRRVSRTEGVVLLALYGAYMAAQFGALDFLTAASP